VLTGTLLRLECKTYHNVAHGSMVIDEGRADGGTPEAMLEDHACSGAQLSQETMGYSDVSGKGGCRRGV
jgi:hypothetical protein